MRCVDLFAGPGGWTEGIAPLGITDIGLELDADACLTRRAAGHQTIRTDVTTYPSEAFRDFGGLIASPPCQAFSSAGKRRGIDDLAMVHYGIEACRDGWTEVRTQDRWADERSPLILEPLRWAWAIRPTWIACEQVPPCLPVWEHMADVLRAWGYQATALKLCAADYGVPQTRTRAFLLAHSDELRVAEPTHAKTPEPGLFGNRKPWVTMAEALGWGMTERPYVTVAGRGAKDGGGGGPDPMVAGGSAGKSAVRGERDGGRWIEGMDRRVGGYAKDADIVSVDRPAPTMSHSHGREVWRLRNGKQEKACERGADEPAPTMFFSRVGDDTAWTRSRPATSVQSTDRIGRPGTKDWESGESQFENDAVRITQEEAAVLQGFRPDYPFQGSKTSRFRQIGNAVPPPWAAKIIAQMTAHTQGE